MAGMGNAYPFRLEYQAEIISEQIERESLKNVAPTGQDSALLDIILTWQNDIIGFVQDMFGVDPTDQQKQLLKAFTSRSHTLTAAATGHSIGKSTVFAWIILWALLMYDEVKIMVTAPSAHQLNDVIWSELVKWWKKMPSAFQAYLHIGAKTVYNKFSPGTRFAAARTSRRGEADAMQGFHSNNLIVLGDESSGIPDEIFEVMLGALTGKEAKGFTSRGMFCGNPVRAEGFFYDIFHKLADDENEDENLRDWITFHMSSEDSPLVSEKYIRIMAKFGLESDQYRVRVKGLFPHYSLNKLFTREEAERALNEDWPYIDDWEPLILGMDCAGRGADKNVIMARQGRKAWIVWEGVGLNTMEAGRVLYHKWLELQPDRCFVDVGGVGPGVIDKARELGARIVEVNFGQKATQFERYMNKRAEMWVEMRDWVREKDGHIEAPYTIGKRIIEELCAPDYMFGASNRIVLEKKDDIRNRLHFSTDYTDALALTFAERHPRKLRSIKNNFADDYTTAVTGKRHSGVRSAGGRRTSNIQIMRSNNNVWKRNFESFWRWQAEDAHRRAA